MEFLGRPRGGAGRLPGVSGSAELLRFSGGGVQAIVFPHREPGAQGGSKASPSHTATVLPGPVPALLTSRPRVSAGWDLGSPSPQTRTLLLSQTQTSNTASLCRPRPAWTGGETSLRSELGTRPPFPGFGLSSVRNLSSLCPAPADDPVKACPWRGIPPGLPPLSV